MAEEVNKKSDIESLFLSWLKTTTGFGSNIASGMASNPENGQKTHEDASNRFSDQWQTNLNFLKSFSEVLKEPESAAATVKSITALPEIFLKMAKSSWEAGFQMQQHIMEKAANIGKRTEAYNFDNLDQEVFKALTEIYEKEFKQYLHIPQLGLTRFYQERFNELLDKHNLFETTLAEFLSVLYLPMEKSFKVLQEKLRVMAQDGVLPKEAKEHYAMWVKILEGHYMSLFKSKEYTDALHNTINKMEDFVLAKNDAMRDVMQFLPVPTNKEMDELYKEFHSLKKRVKELEKKIEELQ
jgi:polyhydroxyalkanoate synthesis regulator phasin